MMTRQAILSEFEMIDSYMQAVREVLSNGHMPDLNGLDGRIGTLCTELEQCDPETQQECLAKLSDMLKRLDECEAEIRAFHAAQTQGQSS